MESPSTTYTSCFGSHDRSNRNSHISSKSHWGNQEEEEQLPQEQQQQQQQPEEPESEPEQQQKKKSTKPRKRPTDLKLSTMDYWQRSITTDCITLGGALAQATHGLGGFVREVRESRADIDGLSREAHSLQTVLELLREDAGLFPSELAVQTALVLEHVAKTIDDLDAFLAEINSLGFPRAEKRRRWGLRGKDDAARFTSALEAHRSILGLAVDLVVATTTADGGAAADWDSKSVRRLTQFREQNGTDVAEDVARIMDDMRDLRTRLPWEFEKRTAAAGAGDNGSNEMSAAAPMSSPGSYSDGGASSASFFSLHDFMNALETHATTLSSTQQYERESLPSHPPLPFSGPVAGYDSGPDSAIEMGSESSGSRCCNGNKNNGDQQSTPQSSYHRHFFPFAAKGLGLGSAPQSNNNSQGVSPARSYNDFYTPQSQMQPQTTTTQREQVLPHPYQPSEVGDGPSDDDDHPYHHHYDDHDDDDDGQLSMPAGIDIDEVIDAFAGIPSRAPTPPPRNVEGRLEAARRGMSSTDPSSMSSNRSSDEMGGGLAGLGLLAPTSAAEGPDVPRRSSSYAGHTTVGARDAAATVQSSAATRGRNPSAAEMLEAVNRAAAARNGNRNNNNNFNTGNGDLSSSRMRTTPTPTTMTRRNQVDMEADSEMDIHPALRQQRSQPLPQSYQHQHQQPQKISPYAVTNLEHPRPDVSRIDAARRRMVSPFEGAAYPSSNRNSTAAAMSGASIVPGYLQQQQPSQNQGQQQQHHYYSTTNINNQNPLSDPLMVGVYTEITAGNSSSSNGNHPTRPHHRPSSSTSSTSSAAYAVRATACRMSKKLLGVAGANHSNNNGTTNAAGPSGGMTTPTPPARGSVVLPLHTTHRDGEGYGGAGASSARGDASSTTTIGSVPYELQLQQQQQYDNHQRYYQQQQQQQQQQQVSSSAEVNNSGGYYPPPPQHLQHLYQQRFPQQQQPQYQYQYQEQQQQQQVPQLQSHHNQLLAPPGGGPGSQQQQQLQSSAWSVSSAASTTEDSAISGLSGVSSNPTTMTAATTPSSSSRNGGGGGGSSSSLGFRSKTRRISLSTFKKLPLWTGDEDGKNNNEKDAHVLATADGNSSVTATAGALYPAPPMYNNNTSSSAGPTATNNANNPIFGVPLKKSIAVAKGTSRTRHGNGGGSSRRDFPLCVQKCAFFLTHEGGVFAPDIFARPGDPARLARLQELFSTGPLYGGGGEGGSDGSSSKKEDVVGAGAAGAVDWRYFGVYDAADLICVFLSRLPTPLIPEGVAKRWISISRQSTVSGSHATRLDRCIDFWEEALGGLRGHARALFKLLLNLWADVAAADDRNDMTAERLAGCVLRPLMHDPSKKYETDFMLALAFLIRKRVEYQDMLRRDSKDPVKRIERVAAAGW